MRDGTGNERNKDGQPRGSRDAGRAGVAGSVQIPVAVIAALAIGVLIGAINAFFILYFRIHSLIVTPALV